MGVLREVVPGKHVAARDPGHSIPRGYDFSREPTVTVTIMSVSIKVTHFSFIQSLCPEKSRAGSKMLASKSFLIQTFCTANLLNHEFVEKKNYFGPLLKSWKILS